MSDLQEPSLRDPRMAQLKCLVYLQEVRSTQFQGVHGFRLENIVHQAVPYVERGLDVSKIASAVINAARTAVVHIGSGNYEFDDELYGDKLGKLLTPEPVSAELHDGGYRCGAT